MRIVSWTRYVGSRRLICLVSQLNGVNTQGENIADNGGVKQAYRAYTAWDERYGPEPKLPGVPLTPKQLFWVSAASTWCSKYRPETLRVRISTG